MSEPTMDGEFVCCNVFRPCYGPTCKHHADNLPATPLPAPDHERELIGAWPKDCVQRAFVDGAKWWEWRQNNGTMWSSDVRKAEDAAVERYGEPHPAPAARVTIDDRFILAVEEEVGMGNGAWDMVPATALCEAVLKVAALSARTGGTE
jgi:hypothetical protein